MHDALNRCELCPRRCGANRGAGRTGYCGAGAVAEVFRYGPHHGEEPPVSGVRGSGTVFFSRCTMRCLYCQNHPWSQEGAGERYDAEGLSGIFGELAAAGCHNVNWVSPTPWLPQIREALEAAKKNGFRAPVVYNTSGFERVETLKEYAGLAQVFLTDLRYSRSESAAAGSDAPGYVDAARAALVEMRRQAGPWRTGEDGVARSGVICRLLVLPGRSGEAVENLRWLAGGAGDGVMVSVMAQYVPLHRAAERGAPWNRRVTRGEYEGVCEEAERLGLKRGWFQEFGADAPEGLIGCDMPRGPGRQGMTTNVE